MRAILILTLLSLFELSFNALVSFSRHAASPLPTADHSSILSSFIFNPAGPRVCLVHLQHNFISSDASGTRQEKKKFPTGETFLRPRPKVGELFKFHVTRGVRWKRAERFFFIAWKQRKPVFR